MRGAVLDTGALVGFERNDRRVVAIVARALDHGDTLFVPAGVVAQAWRDGTRQTRLARLLRSTLCDVVVLDDYGARAAGQLCGATDTADVVDSSVVVAARERRVRIITSDPNDLRRLDRHVDLVAI
ncbi:MAG TPA: PIN domain-containing protein [Acidimicrobiales bacterium]|nr:PIN domain-containing protein [Acidimicrobiales bacterium]